MKRILLLALATVAYGASVMAQWYANPVEHLQIIPDTTGVYDHVIEMAPNGNTWVAFNKPVHEDCISVGLQLVDPEGNKLFDDLLVVSNYPSKSWTAVGQYLYVDRDGNAIVAVVDQRNNNSENPEEEFENYTVYKVSQQGEMLWGKEGITLQGDEVFDLACGMNITQMTDGSYVMAWMHNRANDYNMMSIELQRLSADGELLWNAEEVRLHSEREAYWYPFVVDGYNNQVILVYAKGSSQDLYARKLDFDGSQVWSEDTRIYNGGWGNIPLWTLLTVVPSGDGGVLLTWNDDRHATNIETARMAYIKTDGENGFYIDNGIQLSYSDLRCFSVVGAYHDGSDRFYALWREASASQAWYRMVAQCVTKEGDALWGETGLEIQPIEQTTYGYPTIQCGADDEMAFFYMRNYSNNFGNVEAFITTVNVNDTTIRRTNEFTKCDVQTEKASLKSTAMHNNEFWVTMWDDDGSLGDPDKVDRVYMQRINADLTLGYGEKEDDAVESVTASNKTFAAVATMVSGEAMFVVDVPYTTAATLAIYDINGQLVATPFDGELNGNRRYISWNANVPAGIYMATLTTAGEVQTVKVIVR